VNIRPEGMNFREWADRVVAQSDGFPNADQNNWQVWAKAVIGIPMVAAQLPPRPEYYATWDDWANEFNRAVQL